jgi:hypothetical protein
MTKYARALGVFLLLAVFCSLFSVRGAAQVAISASAVADAREQPVISAKLCFAPVDAAGNATGFRVGSTQILPGEVCGLVANGVLQAGLTLAPNPTGTYYHIYARNRATGTVLRDYGMTAISGSTWSFNTFDPNLATLPVSAIAVGTVTGLAPGSSPTATISGAGPYLLNLGLVKGDTGATGPAGAPGSAGYPGVATDGSNGLTVAGGVNVGGGTSLCDGVSGGCVGTDTVRARSVAPALTPHSDISFYGATIDNVTPVDTALLAAWNAATGTGGSGTVFLPCGTAGCYLANGSLLSTVTTPNNTARIKIQGKLTLGSTWVTPDNTDIICDGNGVPQQFQISGPTCFIDAPHVTGTMGTSTSAINSPTTFTPTFTAGTSANMPANSAITIAGTVSCPITSVTRTLLAGTYPGIGPTNVTAQISGACRIPPGSYITIAGVTDTSFNMSPGLFLISDDYPNGVLTWRQVGAAATSSGGTVTGTNLDSVETVRIQTSVSGVMTATFNHAHSASDVWGMVGMTPKFAGLRKHGFYGIHLAHNYGVGFWGDGNALMTFHEVGFTGVQYPTSFGMEFASSWAWTFDSSTTNTYQAYVCPTSTYNCAQNGFPYGMRATELPTSQLGTSSVGVGFIGPNSTVSEGILIDTEGAGGTPFLQGPEIFNSVIEQPMENGITFDPRGVSQIYQTTIYGASLIQDSIVTSPSSWVGLTDPAPGKGEVMFMNAANLNYLGDTLPGAVGSTVNKYFCGHVTLAGNGGYDHFVWPSCPSATVTYAGWKFAGELSGSGAAFSPSLIPYATKTVTTNVTTCTGSGCSVDTGLLAPDRSMTAFQVNAGPGAYATAQYLNYFNASTATGDVLLYGAWTRSVGMSSGALLFTTFGTDTFDLKDTSTFQGGIDNEPWHVVVGMATVIIGQAGSHAISFLLQPSQTMQGTSAQFWQPFVIHVPASAGISADEISRWRANLLHGYVPSGMGTANVLEINPALPLMWGTDTNLYRGAAGEVKTDGVFNAVAGIKSGACVGLLKNDGTCASTSSTSTGVTLTEWSSGGVKTAGVTLIANAEQIWSFNLPGSDTSTKITYTPSTADNTANLYGIAIHDSTGAVICHSGPLAGTTFAPNTNPVTLTWLEGGGCVLSGGLRYYLGITAVTATAFISTGGVTLLPVNRVNVGATTGAVIVNFTPPADSYNVQNGFPQIALHN